MNKVLLDTNILIYSIENHITDIATFNAKDFSAIEEIKMYLP